MTFPRKAGRSGPQWPLGAALPAMAAMLLLAGCKSPSERAQEYAANAIVLLESGDVEGARLAINKAMAQRDNVADFYVTRGLIELRSDAPDKAFIAFRQALDLDANNVTALAYVANIGVQIGVLKEAEQAADKLLVLDPNSINALQIKGMVALARGKTDEGMALGDKVLALSPANEAGVIIRARAVALKGDIDKAIEETNAAMRATGRTPGMLITLLNLYRAKGDARAMVPLLPPLIEETKGTPAFLIDQANLHYRLGDRPTARLALVRLLNRGSVNKNDYGAVFRLWSEHDPDPLDAAAAREVARSSDPSIPAMVARQLLAMRALPSAGRVLEALPTDRQQQLRGLQARLFDLTGRREEALRLAQGVLKSDAENVDALLVRALAYGRTGEMNLALNDAQRAVQNDPAGLESYLTLAAVNLQLGEKWRARQVFEDGLKRLPQSYELVALYTQFLQTLNDRGRAVSVTTQFARQSPSSPRAWELMAAQCGAAGDLLCKSKAEEGLAKAKTSFMLDDPPGTPVNRGIFGKINQGS